MELATARAVLAGRGWLCKTPEGFRESILAQSHLLSFSAGETIYAEGDPSDGLYGLAAGTLGVELSGPTRPPGFAYLTGKGFWIGAHTLVLGPGRQVGLVALTTCHVLHLSGSAFHVIARRDPESWRWLSILPLMQNAVAFGVLEDLLIREPGILAVSINAGFGDADIRDVGPSVLVTHDRKVPGAESRARELAESLADAIWDMRFTSENIFLDVAEAAAMGKAFDAAGGPLIIADYADNPGSGAYGDATNLLAAMLDAGLTNATFAPVIDPEAAAILTAHKVGDTVTLALGGKVDPAFGGGPLTLTGTVLHVSDDALTGDGPMIGGLHSTFGPTAVLRVAGIDILVVTERGQMLDQRQFKAFGIQPAEKTVVALKSMQHFRAAFESIAGKVVVCDSGALSTPQAHRRPYRNVPRPIFPLDRDMVL